MLSTTSVKEVLDIVNKFKYRKAPRIDNIDGYVI